ncbi:MAG: G-D-S-L family lipolytic protein [Gammaproteobacteria bacterium]|nr:G-D-S-L family lipolytic protein [Gammaproteobacteria bacterium]
MTPKKNTIIKIAAIFIACAVLLACKSDFDNPVGDDSSYSNGDADFSNYVAIGDSLTAGYADAALYQSGQENSFPAIMAKQFATVGGSEFKQPLVNDNLGGLLFAGRENTDYANRLILNAETQSPEPIEGTPTTEVLNLLSVPVNNMGVPGAKSFHLGIDGYGDPAGLASGTANPYFVRFASSTSSSMISDAISQSPSFFTLWIGNNDVLSYATSGGVGLNQSGNLDPSTYGYYDITDPNVFASVYSELVSAITSAPNVKGVLIGLPNVSSIPFFTTVPFNAVPLNQETADALNAAYATYNGGLQQVLSGNPDELALRTISFSAGQNAVVITDEDLSDLSSYGLPSIRQATENDFLVLTTSGKIGTLADANNPNSVWGLGTPLEDSDVLIASEISAIATATSAFNSTIKAIADANSNLAFVNIDTYMQQMASTSGISYGTGAIHATYATGGGFSLDGVHLTARGYAVVANATIDEINTSFNANIPGVNPGDYTTIFIK